MLWLAGLLGLVAVGSVVMVDLDGDEDEGASETDLPDQADPSLSGDLPDLLHEAAPIPDHAPAQGGPQVLVGTEADDTLQTAGTDDQINGYDGEDAVLGGAGNDDLYGGGGDDTVSGESELRLTVNVPRLFHPTAMPSG